MSNDVLAVNRRMGNDAGERSGSKAVTNQKTGVESQESKAPSFEDSAGTTAFDGSSHMDSDEHAITRGFGISTGEC